MLLRILYVSEDTIVCDKSMSERRLKFVGRKEGKQGDMVIIEFDYMRTSDDEICFYLDGCAHCFFKLYWSSRKWKMDLFDNVREGMITMPKRSVVYTWKVTSTKDSVL